MALAPALDLRPPPAMADRPWWSPQGSYPDDQEPAIASIEAEQALLGALLYEPASIKRFTVELGPEAFYEPFHGRLYRAISEWVGAGDTPDPTMLHEEFRRDAAYLELGGVRYLADLVDTAPPAARAADYARHILDLHAKRRLIDLSNQIGLTVRQGHTVSREILALIDKEVGAIRNATTETGNFITARQAAIETLQQIDEERLEGRPRGPQTGLACFDVRLGGLPPGWLITVGARPSMGKTALLRSAFYGAARHNRRDLFALFTIEMPKRELSERALSAASWGGFDEVQTTKLNRSQVTGEEVQRLYALAEALPENLILIDTARLSLEDVRRTVWLLKAKGNLRAIGIDYLQLMEKPAIRGKTDAALIGEITSGLKVLSREADLCTVLASQLTRGVDQREDKRPQLADLRESGSIEQDSNAVLFPFRDAYYLERAMPDKGAADYQKAQDALALVERNMDVLVAKNRQGGLGKTTQRYIAEHDVIEDW